MSRISSVVVISTILAAGCVSNDEAETSTTDQAVVVANGISPNGISPNGISPNGSILNGISPNGISPNGGTIVAATAASGTPPWSGPALVGSRWSALLSDGSTLPLRVDSAVQGTGANADVWHYGVSFRRNGTWQPLCVNAANQPILADTVQGVWNLRQGVFLGGAYFPSLPGFTIACRGSAIAKCVELGYKTWDGLSQELATCVRALRGDYCGDGTPYTVDGTLVNLYDEEQIQADTEAWTPEAEWTPWGARCVSSAKATRFKQNAHLRPSCYPAFLKARKGCAKDFDDGAVIITELAPPGVGIGP